MIRAFDSSRLMPLLAAAVLLLPATGSAQTLRGRVVDDADGRVIAVATVSVVPERSDTVLMSAQTTAGTFHLVLSNPGRYQLRVTALGYTNLTTGVVEIGADMSVTIELRVRARAIALEPLRVLATRKEPWFMPDVRNRQRNGMGTFLDRRQMDEQVMSDLPTILRSLPSVNLASQPNGPNVAVPMVQMRSSRTIGTCFSSLYLDGMLVFSYEKLQSTNDRSQALDEVLRFMQTSPGEIELIEVYRSLAELPAVFANPSADCGVVALWRRTGLEPPLIDEKFDEGQLRFRGRTGVGATLNAVSGRHAPETAIAVEADFLWPIYRGVSFGLLLRHSTAPLAAQTLDELTTGFGHGAVELGQRDMSLSIGGIESRLTFRRRAPLRPTAAVRLLAAQRSFSPYLRDDASVTSRGWGVGASAGLERDIGHGLIAHAAVGYDRISFAAFNSIERPSFTTVADWKITSLVVGLGYTFAR